MRLALLSLLTFASLGIGRPAAPPVSFSWLNARDYGAKGDGRTNERVALQRALDACTQAGGGTVLLPAGVYRSGTLHLGSDTTLHLVAGLVNVSRSKSKPNGSPTVVLGETAAVVKQEAQ